MRFNSFYFTLYIFFLENVEKSLQSGGFREGWSNYSKHSFFRHNLCIVFPIDYRFYPDAIDLHDFPYPAFIFVVKGR